jgi:hypothetical protein
MVPAEQGQERHEHREQKGRPWYTRLVRYVNRKRYQRKRKKEEEAPTDRAARLTATATIWMAIFTLLLILVGGGTYWILKNQLREMHEGE